MQHATFPEVSTLTACSECGEEVALNRQAAKFIRANKTIICSECRRRGRQWSKATYQDYLQSNHWHTFRKKAFQYYVRKCYICGGVDEPIDLHHNDYSRLGGELMSDVIPVCQKCHKGFHSG